MAVQHLSEYFGIGDSVLLKRKMFFQAFCQQPNETIRECVCCLQQVARDCEFGDVMIGVANDLLGEWFLAKDARTFSF